MFVGNDIKESGARIGVVVLILTLAVVDAFGGGIFAYTVSIVSSSSGIERAITPRPPSVNIASYIFGSVVLDISFESFRKIKSFPFLV